AVRGAGSPVTFIVSVMPEASRSSSTSRPVRRRTTRHSKRSSPWPRRGPLRIRPALGCGLVQGHGGANESLQRLLVYLLAFVEVDGTSCVPVKTGVEEARRILQSRPFGEGHLHDVLVSLAGADQSVVRPYRNPSPLPLLDDFGIGLLDQGTEPAEHLAPPVAELLDARVDQLRRRLALLRPALLHARSPSFELCRQTSIYPRQELLYLCKELLPPVFGALVGLLLIRPEARLLHAQVGPRAR